MRLNSKLAAISALVLAPLFACRLALCDCAPPKSRIDFGPAVNAATGPLPVSVVIGDFNGDGLPDFAVGCQLSVLTVHRNRGAGDFSPPEFIQSGDGIQGLAAGDVDQDGVDDLVATRPLVGGNSVVVYRWGPNSYATSIAYSLPDQPTAVAICDMDCDGLPDLVVTVTGFPLDSGSGDGVWLFRNRGGGTFDRAGFVRLGENPRSVVLADFDSDGLTDAAVANLGARTLSILHNRGAFNFDVATMPLEIFSTAIAAGDVNGDGSVDLVAFGTGDSLPPGIRLLINRGRANFEVVPGPVVGQNPETVAIGDLDGDENADIVVGNLTTPVIAVFRGSADGTFGPAGAWPVDDVPYAIALGDLDGDGMPDLLYARWLSQQVAFQRNATTVPARIDPRPRGPEDRVSSRSAGRVTIAILGSPRLDVHAIDPGSIRINGQPIMDQMRGRAYVRVARIDADDVDDLLVPAVAGAVSHASGGCLLVSGRLRSGREFVGSAEIHVNLAEPGRNFEVVSTGRGEIRLAFDLAGPGPARVDLFDVRGARVASSAIPEGASELTLRNSALGVGVYFARLTDDRGVTQGKVVVTGP